jgi:hypothetical protein
MESIPSLHPRWPSRLTSGSNSLEPAGGRFDRTTLALEDVVRARTGMTAVMAFCLSAACSEAGVEDVNLVGTWDATKFELFDAAGGDPVLSVDIVSLGGSVTIVLNSDDSYQVTFTLPFSEPEVEAGTWILEDGDRLILTPTGGVDVTDFRVALSGTTLTVTADDLEFDIDEDGTDDAVTLEAVFSKR